VTHYTSHHPHPPPPPSEKQKQCAVVDALRRSSPSIPGGLRPPERGPSVAAPPAGLAVRPVCASVGSLREHARAVARMERPQRRKAVAVPGTRHSPRGTCRANSPVGRTLGTSRATLHLSAGSTRAPPNRVPITSHYVHPPRATKLWNGHGSRESRTRAAPCLMLAASTPVPQPRAGIDIMRVIRPNRGRVGRACPPATRGRGSAWRAGATAIRMGRKTGRRTIRGRSSAWCAAKPNLSQRKEQTKAKAHPRSARW
jgi:hypothetical protein